MTIIIIYLLQVPLLLKVKLGANFVIVMLLLGKTLSVLLNMSTINNNFVLTFV